MERTKTFLEKLRFPEKTIKRVLNDEYVREYNGDILYKRTMENIRGFSAYGFPIKDIVIIINKNPRCLTTNFNIILEVLEYLESLGYDNHKITKMIKLNPKIFDRNPESIEKRLRDIEGLGFTRDDVLRMFGNCSSIEELSIRKLKQMLEDLQTLGYSEEEVHAMAVYFSNILTFGFEKVKAMVDYLRSVNLDSVVLKKPSVVMQSVRKTYARYMFLKEERGDIVTSDNSARLFESNQRFQKRYGVTEEYLLGKYKYKKLERKDINV